MWVNHLTGVIMKNDNKPFGCKILPEKTPLCYQKINWSEVDVSGGEGVSAGSPSFPCAYLDIKIVCPSWNPEEIFVLNISYWGPCKVQNKIHFKKTLTSYDHLHCLDMSSDQNSWLNSAAVIYQGTEWWFPAEREFVFFFLKSQFYFWYRKQKE